LIRLYNKSHFTFLCSLLNSFVPIYPHCGIYTNTLLFLDSQCCELYLLWNRQLPSWNSQLDPKWQLSRPSTGNRLDLTAPIWWTTREWFAETPMQPSSKIKIKLLHHQENKQHSRRKLPNAGTK
jgi:hypothetical protein